MTQNIPSPSEQRRLIAALDNQTLLGLSKLGTRDERAMALFELSLRDSHAADGSVMGAADRLVAACDRMDALFAGEDPVDSLVAEEAGWDAALGQGRN